MYPEAQMKKQTQSTTGMVLGGDVAGKKYDAAPTPAISPIESRLDAQYSLLESLRDEVDRLATRVSSVMQEDPTKQPSTGLCADGSPVTCLLESKISTSNDKIQASLMMIRRICNQIQL